MVVERTAGEVSDVATTRRPTTWPPDLMHDIVQGNKTVEDARNYYAKEFLDFP